MTRALLRSISSTFANAIASQPVSIDVERARRQHHDYATALARAGLEIELLPADDAFADGCFVEDCAVVVGTTALITRPGAPSRRGEIAAVRVALARTLSIVETEEPALLDGGDCMRVGNRMFVGRSERTNDAGIARLREVFPELQVIAVPVRECLHLKSVCSPIGDRILLSEGTIAPESFHGVEVVMVPAAEGFAANAIALGRTVIAAAGCPATKQVLTGRGFEVIEVDTSEMRKADGALTCLSILY
jgi:dimethylargininase